MEERVFFLMIRRAPSSTLVPCTTLVRSREQNPDLQLERRGERHAVHALGGRQLRRAPPDDLHRGAGGLCERDRHVLDRARREVGRAWGRVRVKVVVRAGSLKKKKQEDLSGWRE